MRGGKFLISISRDERQSSRGPHKARFMIYGDKSKIIDFIPFSGKYEFLDTIIYITVTRGQV